MQITTKPTTSSLLTDKEGKFEIKIPAPGQYKIIAKKDSLFAEMNFSVEKDKIIPNDIILALKNTYEISLFRRSSNSLDSGLVAYYPFNGNPNDESGNQNNGTVHNATLTKDRFGHKKSAYYFNAYITDIHAEHSKSFASITNLDNFSVSVWFYISNWLCFQSDTNFLFVILEKLIIDKQYGWGLKLIQKTNGDSQIILYQGNADISSCDYYFSRHKWYHLVVCFKSDNMTRTYVNGNLIFQSLQNGHIRDIEAYLYIGLGSVHVQKDIFPLHSWGKIDDIRIYNRALTDEEVKQLHNLKN